MYDPVDRWAKLVREPGTVILSGHHAVDVPAQGEGLTSPDARPGLRLMVHPIATARPVHLIDITSTAVQAMLEPFLLSGVAVGKFLSWRAAGYGTRRRDTVILKSRSG